MKKVLIAVDGSDDSAKALAQGGELAKNAGAEIVLVAVQRKLEDLEYYLPAVSYFLKKTNPEDEDDVRKKFANIGEQFLGECKKSLEETAKNIKVKTVLRWGRPADEIIKVAEEEAVDVIVVGCKGKHISKRFMGSVSDEVSERSHASVLVAR